MIGPRIGAGREAEVFAADVDTVVKLYRSGFHGHESEAAALACLDGLGVAPRLIDVTDRHDRRGLVLERLPGVDMLTSLQRRPWRLPDLAQRLATTHVRIHEITAPTALPDLRDLLTQRIHDAPMPSPLRDFALRVLSTLPPGDWLTHGDYHPGNVLV
ncbi:MAG: phosphotransferase, partial [Rhodoglobus sp.]